MRCQGNHPNGLVALKLRILARMAFFGQDSPDPSFPFIYLSSSRKPCNELNATVTAPGRVAYGLSCLSSPNDSCTSPAKRRVLR